MKYQDWLAKHENEKKNTCCNCENLYVKDFNLGVCLLGKGIVTPETVCDEHEERNKHNEKTTT